MSGKSIMLLNMGKMVRIDAKKKKSKTSIVRFCSPLPWSTLFHGVKII